MNQVMPYIPYASQDPELLSMVEGLIGRHARSVLIDSYANAYNFNASGDGHQSDVRTPPMSASIFEGKYEIDSLCAFLKLSYWTWKLTSDQVLFRIALLPSKAKVTSEWLQAVEKTIDTSKCDPTYIHEYIHTYIHKSSLHPLSVSVSVSIFHLCFVSHPVLPRNGVGLCRLL